MVTLNNLYQSEDNYQTGIRVEHALIRSFPDRFLRVAASAFYGIIELTGSVETLYDKSLAMEIAERVPGVTTVVESLRALPIQLHPQLLALLLHLRLTSRSSPARTTDN